MAMTDADLAVALLGWRLHEDGWTWLTPDGCRHIVPDFGHDIEAVMKLARAVCDKWKCRMEPITCSGYARVMFKCEMVDVVHGTDWWDAVDDTGSLEAAIRAAIVNVVEAHAPKGDSDG